MNADEGKPDNTEDESPQTVSRNERMSEEKQREVSDRRLYLLMNTQFWH